MDFGAIHPVKKLASYSMSIHHLSTGGSTRPRNMRWNACRLDLRDPLSSHFGARELVSGTLSWHVSTIRYN
ncbi:hypothetical protein N7510_004962 [Penicillium lagena]|uniref:uncharacterized protein n=1 Tax=Penicillium lagena TaxID=94218 RepID=UPI00253F895F|nr:uncharacterized protein N7510_004962 [Penicillium lagena]KAJ5620978.1 hypothetical protein N7510_004962 [Penicillium lagena]